MTSPVDLICLPPEIRLIIQRYYKRLLHQQKFMSIKRQIQNGLYFWMHLEGMYHMDYRVLPYVTFKLFRPLRTPQGIKRLPRVTTLLIRF